MPLQRQQQHAPGHRPTAGPGVLCSESGVHHSDPGCPREGCSPIEGDAHCRSVCGTPPSLVILTRGIGTGEVPVPERCVQQ